MTQAAAPRLRTLWEFSRPHTIIGTVLAVCALYVLAAHTAQRTSWSLWVLVLIASIAVNVYIVGLNQITDVEIDRISKPYLPLAAGSMGRGVATGLVAATGLGSLVLAALHGGWLLAAIAIVFVIGTCYSLPPIRLKRYPLFAAASIVLARAVVANIGVYLTYSTALTGTPQLPGYVLLLVGFMLGFAVVIAVMKDIPDVEGDRRHRISTVVLRIGPARTLLLCQIVLTACYTGVIAAALIGIDGVNAAVLIAAHVLGLAAVWLAAARVDAEDSAAVVRYYMFIWKLFYLEFLIFPVACLLA
ncbi:homogentisate phytyltransferase/homogentisate geranylgeranyltransferase [Allocatelliglobosispora scoriae]|uniref:Homogentisate phytyltransferase/homogentisate geranylgeranyltransferase n=1 Tax=Allocatelliglobosispora scoriae TaxID=643052 RepID=A0A841BJJ6_9ACTN|nr:homogentisate phytyltransferase [Allocatelliglobosispora scoriae]MBB5866990.1 homogentisate phytyltransferase/homogentisate geranylgeranyltransferase [Allocatelliglobosispora scoriae]